MKILLNYKMKLGKYDSGDEVFEWEAANVPEDAEKAYKRAVMTGGDFEDYPELEAILERAREEIAEYETKRLAEEGDDMFVLECTGGAREDVDRLNELVHSKDRHAIAFFGLDGYADGELAKWDAAMLDEIPLVRDFDEAFKPVNPFENGYRLEVFFPEDENVPDGGEIEAYLNEALAARDAELAKEIVLEQYENYDGNLIEKAFELAAEVGFKEFIDENKP